MNICEKHNNCTLFGAAVCVSDLIILSFAFSGKFNSLKIPLYFLVKCYSIIIIRSVSVSIHAIAYIRSSLLIFTVFVLAICLTGCIIGLPILPVHVSYWS